MVNYAQQLNTLKARYTGMGDRSVMTLRSNRQRGDYMSTLLLMGESDFFVGLYKTVEVNRLILATHLDDLMLKERFDMVNYRSKLIKEHRPGSSTNGGFQDFPPLAYLRKLDQQQMQTRRLLSHLYFYTFEHLQVDQALYAKKLEEEMQVWHLKQRLLRSPHKLDRD
jgi:hypothetical protein